MGMDARRLEAGGSVIVAVALSVVVVLGALAGLGREHYNGTVKTSTIWLVQGGFGGGTVVFFVLTTAAGWRRLSGRTTEVPPSGWLVGGLLAMAAWGLLYASAYGG